MTPDIGTWPCRNPYEGENPIKLFLQQNQIKLRQTKTFFTMTQSFLHPSSHHLMKINQTSKFDTHLLLSSVIQLLQYIIESLTLSGVITLSMVDFDPCNFVVMFRTSGPTISLSCYIFKLSCHYPNQEEFTQLYMCICLCMFYWGRHEWQDMLT